VTNCIKRLAEIYSNNNDKWISDEERGDSVEDGYDGCCGWAGWPKCILILEEREAVWEKLDRGRCGLRFSQQTCLGLE